MNQAPPHVIAAILFDKRADGVHLSYDSMAGPSGSAAVTVLLDGKPVGDVRGADVGSDGVARFDGPRMIRLVAGAARRRHLRVARWRRLCFRP